MVNSIAWVLRADLEALKDVLCATLTMPDDDDQSMGAASMPS